YRDVEGVQKEKSARVVVPPGRFPSVRLSGMVSADRSQRLSPHGS
ncbi:MAG: hypothetical protein ACI8RZ_004286, partial [Myxococcota bacterium]